MHMKTPINRPILRVGIVLGNEKRKTQADYMRRKPKEPPHYNSIWSTGEYYNKPLLNWCEQESRYE
jgi:hypothetical protein